MLLACALKLRVNLDYNVTLEISLSWINEFLVMMPHEWASNFLVYDFKHVVQPKASGCFKLAINESKWQQT